MKTVSVGVFSCGALAALAAFASVGMGASGCWMTNRSVPPALASAGAQADACRGTTFDADRPDPRCLVPNTGLARPPKEALAIQTVPSPAVIRAGQAASLQLELRNVTKEPLQLELDSSCTAFAAVAKSATTSSFESECGGLCGRDAQKLRITLEPGGTVRKAVALTATQRRIAGDDCAEKDLGPLPPGAYTLEVPLPWTDPAPQPENPGAVASRTFSAPLLVSP